MENKNLENLFKYLKEEGVPIDQEEFKYQFASHPDTPSLLAICDTLSFFGIENGAIKINFSEINLLPDNFIANLKSADGDELSLILKKKDSYFAKSDNKLKRVTQNELSTKWSNIVLLIEKGEDNYLKIKKETQINYYLILPLLLSVFFILYYTFSSFWILGFYLFPIVGFVLSLGALKNLFKTKSEFFNKLCNVTSNTDCESVIKSSKWNLFEKISFSDLSLTFFVTQLIALFIIGFTNDYHSYFLIQKILLFASLPVILISIYYQKFVEKKWCPICLLIISVILLELGYVIIFQNVIFNTFNIVSTLIYFFIGLSTLLVWFALKRIYTKTNKLKEEELKANKFKRNYFLFKNALMAGQKYKIPEDLSLTNNTKALTNIDIITSPFCGFCKEPHFMLQELKKNYGDAVNIRTIYFFNIDDEQDDSLKQFYRSLLYIKETRSEQEFYKSMSEWYSNKNVDSWMRNYGEKFDSERIDHLLKSQYDWCSAHKLNFTPCLFINGYKYPEAYDLGDLKYYVQELIEDNFLENSGNRKARIE